MSQEYSLEQDTQQMKLAALKKRAAFLKQARLFFEKRQIIEVDCPLLSAAASVDAHIDLIPCTVFGKETRYLHSSPEYGMKRLLALGLGDIYQLAHVFRDGESGYKHNPEFMMAEWYRCGFSFEQMIEETVDFIRVFLGNFPFEVVSYKEAFFQATGLDPFASSIQTLAEYLRQSSIDVTIDLEKDTKDDLLNIILGVQVEPFLGKDKLSVMAYFPPSQAALAKTRIVDGTEVAERFEVYYKGYELANGYHELQDPEEQLHRIHEANEKRLSLGKSALPIDMRFVEALRHGLPESCGVAVGVDRLVMLALEKATIGEVLSFSWQEA